MILNAEDVRGQELDHLGLVSSVIQRWVMIHSEKAAAREYKTLEKNIKKEADVLSKILWHLSNQTFKCAHDAEISGQQETRKLKYHQISFILEPVEKHVGRGRPKQGVAPITLYQKNLLPN